MQSNLLHNSYKVWLKETRYEDIQWLEPSGIQWFLYLYMWTYILTGLLGKGNWKEGGGFGIQCENIYNNILDKPFPTTLNVVAFPVHIKIKYHNDSRRPIVVKVDLLGARWTQEAILKNPLTTIVIIWRSDRESDWEWEVVDPDVCKAETL